MFPLLRWVWVAVIFTAAIGLAINLAFSDIRSTVLDFVQRNELPLLLGSYGFVALTIVSHELWRYNVWLDRQHELRQEFALFKLAEEISPEDMGFRVVEPGQDPDVYNRPFYPVYITRTALAHENDTHPSSGQVYTAEDLRTKLKEGIDLVLLGPPLDGKSRTLFEIIRSLEGFTVIEPDNKKPTPSESSFNLLRGKWVVLLLDNLNEYSDSHVDLLRFRKKLSASASFCVVAATCRDGSELAAVDNATGEGLRQFYADIPLKLRLKSLIPTEKEQLALSIGKKDWDQGRSSYFPTPGSIVMEDSLRYMRQRFRNLDHKTKDVLRAMQLLVRASVLPLTHDRIQTTMKVVFRLPEVSLLHQLQSLAEQAFVHHPSGQDPIRPEPAYLLDAVDYFDDRRPEDDFGLLADALEKTTDASGLFFLGVKYGSMEKYVEALSCFDRATDVRPDFAQAWYNKGVALGIQGKNDDAIKAYEEALRLKPDYLEAWSNKGSALVSQGKYDEAIRAYEEAIRLKPDDPWAWYNKGVALGIQGKNDDAIKAYEEALRLKPDYLEAWSNKGSALRRQGKNDEAITAYEQALGLKPDLPEVWNDKGNSLNDLGKHGEAIRAYKEALRLRPDLPEAWSNKGNALNNLGRHDEAIKAYDKAIRLKPSFPEAWNNKGSALNSLGQYDDALKACEEAIRLKSDNPEAWNNKGNALDNLGRHYGAIKAYEEAIRLKPDFSRAWSNMGSALDRLGRFDEAVKACDVATVLEPGLAQAWNNKGNAWNNLGKHDEAIKAYEEAIRLKPGFPEAWNGKGNSLQFSAQYDRAIEAYREAVRLRPEYAEAWFNMGSVLARVGRRGEGIECLSHAWRDRERLPDKGALVKEVLAELGIDPEKLSEEPPLQDGES